MGSTRIVPGAAVLLMFAAACAAGAFGEICRVHAGNTRTIGGFGFEPDGTEIFAWSPPFDKDKTTAVRRVPGSTGTARLKRDFRTSSLRARRPVD